MPIPGLTNEGYLPEGIHEATLAEVEDAFGRFKLSDRRPVLFQRLRTYCDELRAWGRAAELLLDGSFISAKESPGDVDILLVYPAGFDFGAPVLPAEYNVIKSKRVQRLYGFDVIAVTQDSTEKDKWISYFCGDTRIEDLRKGLVRIRP